MAKRLSFCGLVLAAGLLTVAAYWLLFTTFMSYDDEGYVLVSLQNYVLHGGLYAKVYSQYGPFFYFVHDLGHRLLGYAFTNTTGRLTTLVCWMITVATLTHVVWRQTRSRTLTAATLGLTFFHLWPMVSEPGHPGGLIAAVLAVGAWAGTLLIDRRAWTALAVVAGLTGAALLLTKINVGLFFLLGAGAWFAIQLRGPRIAAGTTCLVVAALAVLPFGLMASVLKTHQSWAEIFAGLSFTANLTMLAIAWRQRENQTTWGHGLAGGVAGILLAGVVTGIVVARGTTWTEMLHGMLLGPLRHPTVYHFAPSWNPGAWLGAALSIGLATAVWRGFGPRLATTLVLLRFLLVIWIGLGETEFLPVTSHSSIMSFGIPFAWIFVLPLGSSRTNGSLVATWLGLLVVLQYLHAFPVAGSQVAWGTVLLFPLFALGLHDAANYLGATRGIRLPRILLAATGVLGLFVAGRLSVIGWNRYAGSPPLRLPGAEDVRPTDDYGSILRLLSLNARAHGDMLFTMPGMFSFNQWTGLPTPTQQNTTHWFSLLTTAQQDEIAHALTASRRPVLIVQRELNNYLIRGGFNLDSPLATYLKREFQPVFALGPFEYWVRKNRVVVPLANAELLELREPTADLAPNRLDLTVIVPAGAEIARIELAALDDPKRAPMHWDSSTSELRCVGVNLSGAPVTAEFASAWNRPLPPIAHLSLPLPRSVTINQVRGVVHVRDGSGGLIAEARFTQPPASVPPAPN